MLFQPGQEDGVTHEGAERTKSQLQMRQVVGPHVQRTILALTQLRKQLIRLRFDFCNAPVLFMDAFPDLEVIVFAPDVQPVRHSAACAYVRTAAVNYGSIQPPSSHRPYTLKASTIPSNACACADSDCEADEDSSTSAALFWVTPSI